MSYSAIPIIQFRRLIFVLILFYSQLLTARTFHCKVPLCFNSSKQWRRQRSKGARSFRGQKILQPGHLDALFFIKKVDELF